MRSLAAVSLVVSLLLAASSGQAGVIRGAVSRGPEPKGDPKSLAAAAKRNRGVVDAVVYLDRVPERVERKLTSRGFLFFRWRPAQERVRKLVMMDGRFKPRSFAVATGGRVAFENLDRVIHSPFSVSAAKRFDLGKRRPGRSDTLTFSKPGVINIHCDVHPDMVGFLLVTPNHAFTIPDSSGSYQLPKLPAGDYTVRAFHPTWGQIERRVEMPARGDVVLDLRF